MLKTKLRDQIFQKRATESRIKFNKQSNLCAGLTKKPMQQYTKNLGIGDIAVNIFFFLGGGGGGRAGLQSKFFSNELNNQVLLS